MSTRTIAMLLGALWAAQGGAAGGESAPEDPLARLALTEYLGTTDAAMIRELVTRTRQDLESGARRAPAERRMASVFLRRGLHGADLAVLLEPRGLALARMASKRPLPNAPGKFVPVIFESRDFNQSRHGLAQRVDEALLLWREQQILTGSRAIWDPSSGAAAPPTEKELRATVPHLRVYEIGVVGTREALRRLLEDPAVRAVFVDEDARRVTAFEDELRRFADWL